MISVSVIKNISNFYETDKIFDIEFKNKNRSSSHFLSEIIHEWCHNLHLDLLYKKYGYSGECSYGKQCYITG